MVCLTCFRFEIQINIFLLEILPERVYYPIFTGGYPREIPNGFHMVPKMPLPIFGMASYKFKISVWDQNGEESQKANSLLQAADEWLRVLNVNHPDYRFFISRNFNCR